MLAHNRPPPGASANALSNRELNRSKRYFADCKALHSLIVLLELCLASMDLVVLTTSSRLAGTVIFAYSFADKDSLYVLNAL